MRTHPLRLIVASLLLSTNICRSVAQTTTDAQGDVGIGTTHPHPSAIVELSSDAKGFLPPRMTTAQRDAISIPADGLMIFNTDHGSYQYWRIADARWETMGATAAADEGHFEPAADDTYTLGVDTNRWKVIHTNGSGIHIGAAGGELTGAELAIGYDAGAAVIDVDGAGDEITVTTTETSIGNDLVLNGDLIATNGHLRSAQTAGPAASAAGPHVAGVMMGGATDIAGHVSITTSSAPLPGLQAMVTFNTPYLTPPIVTLTPADPIAPGVGAYVTRMQTGFVVGFMGMPASSTSYTFFYQVIETE